MNFDRWTQKGFLPLLTALLSGCAGGGVTGAQVSSSPTVAQASVQVDVVGVTASDRGIIEGVPVSKYFQSTGKPLRIFHFT